MPHKPQEWVNVSDHAVTLATGEPVAANGGRAQSDMSTPHDRALRDEGHLIRADDPDYRDWSPEELHAAADARGVSVTGTGKDGHVLKADLITALETDDKTKEAN
jgi:hypothetical protein